MKQITFTFRTTASKIKKAREKAGDIALSVVLRKLLDMWLDGEIEIKI